MTTLGLWHYPINPSKTIPGYDQKNQFRMNANDISRLQPGNMVDVNEVTVSEDIAFKLAEKSPNPQKATNAVYLLAANDRLKLLPLAALLFASSRRLWVTRFRLGRRFPRSR